MPNKPHHSIITGHMLFLMPSQQCQSTDGICSDKKQCEQLLQLTHLIQSKNEYNGSQFQMNFMQHYH